MSKLKPYEHRVQYYETDQMGIVHHSNYIRWFEEARIDAMRQVGLVYKDMETAGIIIPVLEAQAEYKAMTYFDDVVEIVLETEKYNGIVMSISYEVKDKATGEIRCTGRTKHCFLDEKGHPMLLKRSNQVFHEKFMQLEACNTES